MTAAVPAAPQPPPAAATPGRAAYEAYLDELLKPVKDEVDRLRGELAGSRYEPGSADIGPGEKIITEIPAARPLTAPDVVAGLLADVAERDERLAAMKRVLAETSREVTTANGERDESRARLADAAPELAAAMAETRQVRDGYQELCREFGPSPQSGWSARVSLTSLNRHRERAGLPGLPRNAAAGEREDVTMRYRRERDEACEQLAEVRKLAESWAGRAPAARSIAEDLMTPPRDSVSADCGRELLACLEADGG